MTAPPAPRTATAPLLAATAALYTPAAAALSAPLLLRHRLPDPVALHWSALGGPPDGSGPLAAAVAIPLAALLTVCGSVLLMLRSGAPTDHTTRSRYLALQAGCAAFFTGLGLATLTANLDAAHWTAAHLPAAHLAATAAAALAAAGLGWTAGHLSTHRPTRL
ncbi:hypothetical protein [Nocardiopsis coralliicola]